jgi:predicted transposase YbfD/YdcC
VEERALHAFPTDGMEMDFPFARSVVVVRSRRTQKKDGTTTHETRAYVSSLEPEERTPELWHHLIRGHWAGVENRNHWRRDALFGEDRSRSRHSALLTNLALIRTALLRVIGRKFPGQSLPSLFDRLKADPRAAFLAVASW